MSAAVIPVPPDLHETVARALREDVGDGDATAALVSADARASATVSAKESCVICGIPFFDEAMRQLDPSTRVRWHVAEGDRIAVGTKLCTIEGLARSILTAERVGINFLQTLSSTATATRRYVDAIATVPGARAKVVDTRKTIPGLRLAQKYAVLVGGGANHRIGLFDGILIKENHIVAAGGIAAAMSKALSSIASAKPGMMVEIEVETLEQLDEAIAAGAKLILLDNFTTARMAEAVQRTAGRAALEASGGINIDTIRAVAATGVDQISVGALTKDVKAIDLSMRFMPS